MILARLVICSCSTKLGQDTAKIELPVDLPRTDHSDMRRRNRWLPLCCPRSKRKRLDLVEMDLALMVSPARPATRKWQFSRLNSYFAFAQKKNWTVSSDLAFILNTRTAFAHGSSTLSIFDKRRPVSNQFDATRQTFHKQARLFLCNEELRNPPASCMEMTLGHRDFPSLFSEICTSLFSQFHRGNDLRRRGSCN